MVKKIHELRFKLISPQIIKKMSVMQVNTAEVYDVDAYPIEGGVMDPRLGVVDPGMRCRTCGGRMGECTGHFGHIELARPVINILFLDAIKILLQYTCADCGVALVDKEIIKKIIDMRDLKKLKPLDKCPKCGRKTEKITIDKPSTFVRAKKPLTAVDVREQLERITTKTAESLSFCGGKPEWLVLTLFAVPPITVRPSITLETGDRSEDDLTHKIVDIVRINQRFADNLEIGAPEFILEDLWELLQYHVTTFFNNELSSIPPARHRSGRSLKTLSQRLKSKDGRFRHNLTGKRVNYSARTVISPDPNISINEVGVPERIAKEITVSVKVTKSNLSEMKKYVTNGPDVHPGANYVTRDDDVRKRILEANKSDVAEELAPGYLVERHLIDGDPVIFNRQPSLHRMSVMGHRARIMPHKTFRLNLCVCKPYNADFDGDEMNMHVPQTAEARAEVDELMLVENNIRSPRFGGPIIGCEQDYISGAYLLTKKGTTFSRRDIAQMFANAGVEVELEKDVYTGKEMLSMLIPSNINLEYKSNVCRKCKECTKEKCPYDSYVVIKDGNLEVGVVDNTGIAPFKGKIVDAIDLECGHAEARKFLDSFTRVILEVMMRKGFSISLSDLDVSKETTRAINNVVSKQFAEVEDIIARGKKGQIDVSPGRTLEESEEALIMVALSKVTNESQNIIAASETETDADIMAKTGARGSIQNLTFMSGILGQEAIRGKRIFRGYNRRTLPHFKKDVLEPKAHGFVTSSLKDGLDPVEFFFEVMKGREGIMDSSLKTRVSGYMQRRLVNALQDIMLDKDMIVKDGEGTVVQFVPGEDGIDPAKSDRGSLDVNIKF